VGCCAEVRKLWLKVTARQVEVEEARHGPLVRLKLDRCGVRAMTKATFGEQRPQIDDKRNFI
jgi:hypothetical protein